MAINKTDIKLMASERLTDFYDGGGAMTGTEITSGEINNLFPDISRLDRTYGRVSLRKCFPAVMTLNQDMYYGSHAIITDPPTDDNVFVSMFSRDDFDDTRQDAQNRIESYISIGGQTLLRPMYDQLSGQRAIVCFQTVGNDVPEIGTTIALVKTSTGEQQYVRITALETVRTTFQNSNGSFAVDVLTIDISAPLEYTFPGIEPTPNTTLADTKIHSTVVADASKYYGVSKVNQAITQGDFNIWVDSIYNQLVPTSQIESPVVDQFMGGDTFTYYAKGAAGSLTFSGTRTNATPLIHLPDGILPGSLNITIGGYAFVDNRGLLSAVDSDGGFSGTVDYASGQISIEKATWSESIILTATPACPIVESYVSSELVITIDNRSYNYTPNLSDPLPQPGNIVVDYMAQGKWYRLYDDGRGVFTSNDVNVGTGTVDYVSGSCVITLGALPDVGSSVILSWGAGIEVQDLVASVNSKGASIKGDLGYTAIIKGSVTLSWDDGTPRSVTDDVNGVFTGDGTVEMNYGTGTYILTPNPLPTIGISVTEDFDYDAGSNSISYGETNPTWSGANNDIATFTLPTVPVDPLTFSASYTTTYAWYTDANNNDKFTSSTVEVADNGSGSIIIPASGQIVGSIDYNTGVVSFTAKIQFRKTTKSWTSGSTGWGIGWVMLNTNHSTEYSPAPPSIGCVYQSNLTAAAVTMNSVAPTTDFKVALIEDYIGTAKIIPNSVAFTLGGSRYYDVGNGDIYKDKDPTTGVGSYAGTINYSTSVVTLENYTSLTATLVVVESLLSKEYDIGIPRYVFRTPGSPLRAGSFSCRANAMDGSSFSAISDTAGVLSSAGIDGTVDNTQGIVRVRFGNFVAAAGNEAEPWYDANFIENGQIFLPVDVIPETALYNAVYYSTLPLDASLVGIEPIRLPTDGRVPIFKSGDVVVLHHTDNEILGSSWTTNQVVTLNRNALSIIDLYDYQGNLIPEDPAIWTYDLDLGTITIVDETVLTGMGQYTNNGTENVTVNHKIEDMLLLSEAQINGYLTTVGPITHDYPAIGAQLSTALIFGDLAGRVVRMFTQKTWDGVFRDTLSGADSTAKYDDLNYPFIITNQGASDQRWCLKFIDANNVQIIGESFGVIEQSGGGNWPIANPINPTNPATGQPYFYIDPTGWGGGWASGNNIRFDTTAANYPVWLVRTTMQGPVTDPTDNFVMQIRGDAN